MTRRAHRGFVLPVVAVLLGMAALLLADALGLGAHTSALASRELLRTQAQEGAEAGLAAAATELAAHAVPRTRRHLQRDDGVRVDVALYLDLVESLPAGYSAGRLKREHYRVESIATGERGSRLTLEAGLSRLTAASAP